MCCVYLKYCFFKKCFSSATSWGCWADPIAADPRSAGAVWRAGAPGLELRHKHQLLEELWSRSRIRNHVREQGPCKQAGLKQMCVWAQIAGISSGVLMYNGCRTRSENHRVRRSMSMGGGRLPARTLIARYVFSTWRVPSGSPSATTVTE